MHWRMNQRYHPEPTVTKGVLCPIKWNSINLIPKQQLSSQETLLMLLNEPASSNILSFQYRYKRKDKHQGSQIEQQIVRCRMYSNWHTICCLFLYIYPLLSSVPSFFIGHQFPSYLKVVNPCAWFLCGMAWHGGIWLWVYKCSNKYGFSAV